MNEFDDIFLKEQKTKLLHEKARLEQELKNIEKFPEYGNNDEDNSEEVESFLTSQGQDKQLLQMLTEIKEALTRIDNGTYGYCANCKEKMMIDKKRLEAFPAATTCINCEKNNAEN